MSRSFAVASAAVFVCWSLSAHAADVPSTFETDAPSGSNVGSNRLTMSVGAPAIGGLWIDGGGDRSFSDLSAGTPGLVGTVELGHVFAPWLELGVGFEAQHRIGSSLGAYRPYGFARAFANVGDAEIGFALRAGPTWFHFDVGNEGTTLVSVAPSAVVDARVWIFPRVALVASIEALVSGAQAPTSGASSSNGSPQVWNASAIASLGVSFRL